MSYIGNAPLSISSFPDGSVTTLALANDSVTALKIATGGVVLNSGDVTGTLPVSLGGTGTTTVASAINALLPAQGSASGKVLSTDGTNPTWVSVEPPPGFLFLAQGII